ncbi:hypothetical protein [Nonomuraea longicatena]|uniref:Uncharacterized protein n=1 Tax=Nonomuraea longicatena TaxID=83682 RepID=A0ABN1NLR9_9ACTN
MIQGSSWFVRDKTGQGALALAIQRVCAPLAGDGTRIHTADLPLGGVQVWAETHTWPPHGMWALHHRMAREIALAGWHTEIGDHLLLVLGWSADRLDHRARVLRNALAHRLADHGRTTRQAIRLVTRLLTSPFPASADPAADAVAAVARDLRWPARLDALDGLQRTSTLDSVQLRLAQVAGLEADVRRRCAEHLDLAWRVTRKQAGLLDHPAPADPLLHPLLQPVPTRGGPTERRVAATVPNRPLPSGPHTF